MVLALNGKNTRWHRKKERNKTMNERNKAPLG
uniref:Uncharacterized protein n=1 Tax=Arundo donax TaxID=35708 RepID=A0A0A9CBZ0_ARUDO